ncbi:MAG: IS200/IS605 family transposase [Cyanobacteria bacterium QH_7_48_89]|nr:MAG: IS200/IS605 family transposase [Cyanobacteria bacterium QH_7_48_89]
MQQFRKGRHSVTDLEVHLVFVTKYRRKFLTPVALERLSEVFKDTARKMDFEVLEVNGEADHVHLLVEYPPKMSISKLVNHLKGVSSRTLRAEMEIETPENHLWSPSYFASSCGGASLDKIKDYI